MVDIKELVGEGIETEFCNVVRDEDGGLELCLAHDHGCYVSRLRYDEEESTLYIDFEAAKDNPYWTLKFPCLLPIPLPEGVKKVKTGNREVIEDFPDQLPYYTEGIPEIEYI